MSSERIAVFPECEGHHMVVVNGEPLRPTFAMREEEGDYKLAGFDGGFPAIISNRNGKWEVDWAKDSPYQGCLDPCDTVEDAIRCAVEALLRCMGFSSPG